MDWRSGRLSDWSVRLGPCTFKLHAFILARGSHFFEGHTNSDKQTGAKCESDITEIVPRVCHECFESALDFLYSENQDSFEIQLSDAMLMLKIADVLGMPRLLKAAAAKIRSAPTIEQPLFLMQYHKFHIPGTNESEPLQELVDSLTSDVTRAFQQHLFSEPSRQRLLQFPAVALQAILRSDELKVLNEDEVLGLVAAYCRNSEDGVVLWDCVRWEYVSTVKFEQLTGVQQQRCELAPDVLEAALRRRLNRYELGLPVTIPKPRAIRPPKAGNPSALDIDMCFRYSPPWDAETRLRSETLQVGDFVCRLLVFPGGTQSARNENPNGFVSVFLEAVPQAHWPPDWKFKPIGYQITCYPWSPEADSAKAKRDTFCFCSAREDGGEGIDRGWHDFLTAEEARGFLSPDGILMIRGSLKRGTLSNCFFE